jgi:hypothetical protein
MKKLLFIMFIIINVLVLMTLPGCKKGSNIAGIWSITTTLLGETSPDTYTFLGNKGWGVVLLEGQALGTYSVAGEAVSFTMEYYDAEENHIVEEYTGFFDGKDFMSGSFTHTVTVIVKEPPSTSVSVTSGTWFGER